MAQIVPEQQLNQIEDQILSEETIPNQALETPPALHGGGSVSPAGGSIGATPGGSFQQGGTRAKGGLLARFARALGF